MAGPHNPATASGGPGGADSTGSQHGPKGRQRRAQIVAAAAELVVADGPAAVSHRAVARRAGVSLSATTYYFASLQELLGQAGALIMGRWAEQAEAVAARAATTRPPASADQRAWGARLLVEALLPASGVLGHYQQLLRAKGNSGLTGAYRAGRGRLDAALSDILDLAGARCPPALVLAVVDGAVISALSEGHEPAAHAERLAAQLLALS